MRKGIFGIPLEVLIALVLTIFVGFLIIDFLYGGSEGGTATQIAEWIKRQTPGLG